MAGATGWQEWLVSRYRQGRVAFQGRVGQQSRLRRVSASPYVAASPSPSRCNGVCVSVIKPPFEQPCWIEDRIASRGWRGVHLTKSFIH